MVRATLCAAIFPQDFYKCCKEGVLCSARRWILLKSIYWALLPTTGILRWAKPAFLPYRSSWYHWGRQTGKQTIPIGKPRVLGQCEQRNPSWAQGDKEYSPKASDRWGVGKIITPESIVSLRLWAKCLSEPPINPKGKFILSSHLNLRNK